MVRMRGEGSSAVGFKCEPISSNISVLTDKSSSKVICSPEPLNDITGHSASRCFKIYTRRRCEDNSRKALPLSKVIASPASENSHETGPLVASPSTCITSPASQESHATGPLVASSSTCIGSQSLDPLHGNGRKEGYYFRGMASARISCRKGAEYDPRSRLNCHIADLLKAAGWLVKRHKILGKNSLESKYTSPTGRAFREFHKVWKQCGELLLGDRYVLVEEDDGLLWVDVDSFFSDLHDTLSNIEKEQQSVSFISLAHWWNLLDPFVTVISIDKQIGLLRNGEAVKARRRWLTDKDEKRKLVLALKQGCENKWRRPIALGHELEINERRSIVLALSRGGADVAQLTKGQIPFPHPSEHEITDDGCHTNALTSQLGPDCFIRYICQGTEEKMELLPEKSICGCNGDDKVEHDREAAKCWNKVDFENPTPIAVCSEDANAFPDSCFDHESDKVRRYLLAAQDNCLNNGRSLVPDYCQSLVPVDLDDESNHPKILLNQEERTSSVFRAPESTQQTVPSVKKRLHCYSPDFSVKKKVRRKSKRISELKSIELREDLILERAFGKAELLDVGTASSQTELGQVQEATNVRSPPSCRSSPLSYSNPHIKKTRAKHKKMRLNCGDSKWGDKLCNKCEIEDDDLLVSAIIRTKGLNESASTAIAKPYKSKARRMMKSKVGRCRLLPRYLVKGSKLSVDGKWPMVGPRTVLSWLINSGIIMLDDVIQYCDPDKKSVIKDGRVTTEGISCNCCKKKLSLTQFKVHAGFKLSRPCLNLFMDSGEPFTLSELRAWSSEYKTRKSVNQTSQSNHFDQNDDSCGLCGDGGELICCDNCPSTYHWACLSTEDLPDGNWYCSNCTCRMCGCLVIASSVDARKCLQCEHKYHESCVNLANEDHRVASDAWFCGANCQEVYIGLNSRIGTTNHIADGYSWTLLRCIHDDQKVHSAHRFAVKAECNSKLAVALSIMEECFTSMVDPRTGIDMIPHVLYNWGSDFARLNFLGFYTVVLDKDDELITVASIRVHGAALAEIPLVATCSKFRRQGMCRRIMAVIEELLMSVKVEKLVIASIPETVETWTKGFGFKVMEKDEKESLKRLNLMVLPGTILLTKTLFARLIADSEAGGGEDNLSPSSTTGSTSRSDLLDNLCPSETSESKLHRNCESAPLKHDGTKAENLQVIENPGEEPNTAAAGNNLEAEAEELDVIEEPNTAGEQDTAAALEIDSQEYYYLPRIEFKQHQTEKEARVNEDVVAIDVHNTDIEEVYSTESDGEVVRGKKVVKRKKKGVKRKKGSKRNKFAEEFWMPPSWGLICGLHAASVVNKEEKDTPISQPSL